MKEAEVQWNQWAIEIKQGKRQSFLSMLEERGFVNSVVGCVFFFFFLEKFLSLKLPSNGLRSQDEFLSLWVFNLFAILCLQSPAGGLPDKLIVGGVV
jgi:hypothetical protein